MNDEWKTQDGRFRFLFTIPPSAFIIILVEVL
jgi:hypothetical protein